MTMLGSLVSSSVLLHNQDRRLASLRVFGCFLSYSHMLSDEAPIPLVRIQGVAIFK